MKILLCSGVLLLLVAVPLFVAFVIVWRRLVAIPSSFEVTETPPEADEGLVREVEGGGDEVAEPAPVR